MKHWIEKANELNLAVTLKKEHRIITKEPDEYVLETQRYFGNQIGPVEKYNGTDLVDMMIIYGPKGWDYKPFLDLEGISVLPGLSCFADVAIAGVSKATGIMELGKVLGSDHYVWSDGEIGTSTSPVTDTITDFDKNSDVIDISDLLH